MIETQQRWIRVSKRNRCPICNRGDWCLIAPDGTAAICPRTPDGAIRHIEGSGYLHKLSQARSTRWTPPPRRASTPPPARPFNWNALWLGWVRRTPQEAVERLSAGLGVSGASLLTLGASWAPEHAAWAFPMYSASREIIGIRLRAESGDKWAVKGSRNGLFWPATALADQREELLVCEGPTTCAALMDLGYDVLGRPSCMTGDGILRDILRVDRRHVVIVADLDKPTPHMPDGAGRHGAERLAKDLWRIARSVRIIEPLDGKDARDWIRAGATKAVVDTVIRNARYLTPALMKTEK